MKLPLMMLFEMTALEAHTDDLQLLAPVPRCDHDDRRRARSVDRDRRVECRVVALPRRLNSRLGTTPTRAEAKRDAALKEVRVTLAELTENVHAFTDAETELAGACVAAGRRHHDLREACAELVVIAATDDGLRADDQPLPYVRASVRVRLLAQFPPPAVPPAPANGESVTVAACTVCQHPERVTLEAALAGGASYREVAASFNVSRAAVGRHVAHVRLASARLHSAGSSVTDGSRHVPDWPRER
jgi:hypothetical protein